MAKIQSKARIGAKEMTAMLVILVGSEAFLSYPRYVSQSGFEAAWMEPLLSGGIALTLFLVIEHFLRKYFFGKDMLDMAVMALGHIGAVVFTVLLALYFLMMTAVTMRGFMENTVTTMLPTTPLLIIGTLFIVSVGYITYTGLEGIARLAYFALPVLIVGTLMICVFSMKWWVPADLAPVLGSGLWSIFVGSANTASIFLNVLMLSILNAHAHDAKSLRTVGITSTVLTSLLLSGFLLTYHMVFPVQESMKLTFPFYSMARMIYLSRFLQRFESIFIFLWVMSAVIRMAILLWAAAYLLGRGLKWSTYRPSIPALALICLAASLIPTDVSQVMGLEQRYVLPYGTVFVFAAPLFVTLVARMRRTTGTKEAGNRG